MSTIPNVGQDQTDRLRPLLRRTAGRDDAMSAGYTGTA